MPFAAKVSQAVVETAARDGLPGGFAVPLDLVADCGANEVGAGCVEAVSQEQIDVTEVGVAERLMVIFSLSLPVFGRSS